MAKKISRCLPGLSLGEIAPASKGTKQPKRNGHAFHPIMNKGGAHEKSKGAQRAAAKKQTNQKVREWLGRSSISAVIIYLNYCLSQIAPAESRRS